MSKPPTIDRIAEYQGKRVVIRGWLYNKRHSGKIWFLLIRDGTGIIQGTVSKKDVDEETFEICSRVTMESSLQIEGVVRRDERAPGGYEIQIERIEIVQIAREYPIAKKEHGVGFLMAHRHLWLRSKKQVAIARIRAEVVRSIRDFFDRNGFLLVDAPILTPTSVEGTTTLFPVEYFDRKVYLTQSGQLYNEAAAAAFGRVYCFGPTFRAEKSKTRRHLTEFWMVEPEVAFIDLDGLIELAEELIVSIVTRVLEERRRELEILERDLTHLEKVKRPLPRISYDEAVKLVQQQNPDFKWSDDFGGRDMTIISEQFDLPFTIHHFPVSTKAFYMKVDRKRAELSESFDCYAPEGYGEIIGGGMREDDYDRLLKRIEEEGLPKGVYDWYLDLRRYGSFPHGGFGLGLERTVAWICGIHHLRETIAFPRLIDHVSP
ncbi:asparagine--tRNA ligase [candidate division WOR-3 bacterium]|uniref:Asparagine--tRNA ligase n=1 Tax=candidate division WOR-3 bacterium TaxID=2052148 RepID=A0A660SF55_UNCW3|nr:MAG: asparagine--tRNA ligase [candidate division WOR-3 bacterium]